MVARVNVKGGAGFEGVGTALLVFLFLKRE